MRRRHSKLDKLAHKHPKIDALTGLINLCKLVFGEVDQSLELLGLL